MMTMERIFRAAAASSRLPSPGRGFLRAAVRVCLAAVLVLLLLPSAGFAKAKRKAGRKVVRIPLVELNRVMVADAAGRPVSGYAYDYIQTIATYAGWDVEYLPAANFAECIDMLVRGDADLFYELSHTEEREKRMLFPDEPMGLEYYYLYVSEENTDIAPDDYASLEGKRVGVTRGTMQIDLLRQDYRLIGGKGVATLASDLAFVEEPEAGKTPRIGVNRNNLMQYYYSKDAFPDAQIVFYDGIRACLDGLLEGTSDGTFVNGARTAGLLRPGQYHSLQAVRAKDSFAAWRRTTPPSSASATSSKRTRRSSKTPSRWPRPPTAPRPPSSATCPTTSAPP